MRSTLTGNKNLDIDILNRLNDKDLVSFCRTSKYANQLCNDQILWQRRTIDRWGDIISLEIMKKYKDVNSWSEYYINLNKNNRLSKNFLLNEASRIGRLDLLILAVNKGADIRADHDNTLRTASKNGHLDVVKYLVDKGADIHAEDDYAFRWASLNGHLDVVKYLVDKGADIHARYGDALRSTSHKGHLDVVKYLVSQGAYFNELDSALRWARREGHTDIVNYLEEQIKLKYK